MLNTKRCCTCCLCFGSFDVPSLCRSKLTLSALYPQLYSIYLCLWLLAGRKARYIYGGAALHPTQNRPVQSVARYDVETGHMQLWSKGSRYFMGEPQFIPRHASHDPGLHPLQQQPHGPHAESHAHGSAAHAGVMAPDADGIPSHGIQSCDSTAAPSAGQSASSTNGFRSSHTAAERQDPTSSSHAHDGLPAGINEDDGWVLSVGFDAELQRSELVLLDAAEIEAGPIAVLPLASPVGFGIHGTWVPTYFGP